MMVGSDIPDIMAASQVAAEAMKQAGMNVDVQVSDWGSVVQRRISRKPVSRRGLELLRGADARASTSPTRPRRPTCAARGRLPLERVHEERGGGGDLYGEVARSRRRTGPAEALPRTVQVQLGAGGAVRAAWASTSFPTVHRRSIGNMTPGGLIRFWGLTKEA